MSAFPYDLGWLERLDRFHESKPAARVNNRYSLGLGVSNACNFHCPHCYYRGYFSKRQEVSMPVSLLQKILADMPILQSIIFGLEGEPFLYPHLLQALHLASERTDCLMIVSNGSLLTGETCRALTDFPVKRLVLSVDAATADSYERFRSGGSFNAFKANCSNIVDALGNAVSLHAVMFSDNLPFLPSLPGLAASLGVERISFQQLRSSASILQRGIQPPRESDLLDCLLKIIDSASSLNISLEFASSFGNNNVMSFLIDKSTHYRCVQVADRHMHKCGLIHNFTSILSDGKLFPCCGDFEPYEIAEYTFDGIFNHSYLRCLRYFTDIGYNLEPCAICQHKRR